MNNLETLARDMARPPLIQVPPRDIEAEFPAPLKGAGGWVYILTTSYGPKRYKLGMTRDNPLVRFAKLRCGDPYLSIRAAYYVPARFGKPREIEAYMHRHDTIHPHRIQFFDDRPSEWFLGDAKYAEINVTSLLAELTGTKLVRFTVDGMLRNEQICFAYDTDLEEAWGPAPYYDEDGIPW